MIRAIFIAAVLLFALDGASARADPLAHVEPLARVGPPPSAAPKSDDGVVNLNDASEDELTRLPGIGPGKARAIAEHRHAHPFRRIDELTKVKGIGRKTFGRLRPYITTVGPTTLAQKAAARR
jgi:competence protein ComEA